MRHLCRYVLRPPVAQEALELTAEGRVLLRLRRPWRDGTRAIRFAPSELLERLAALVPRPRGRGRGAELGGVPTYGITFGWLIGEIVQRVSGRTFAQFVQEEIAGPLDLDGLWVGVPAQAAAHAAELLMPDRRRRRMASLGDRLDRVQRLTGWFGVPYDLRRATRRHRARCARRRERAAPDR